MPANKTRQDFSPSNKFMNVPVNEPLLNGNEKKYLNECIDTGWISSEGPFIGKFESQFARYIGRKYAIAVSNGTVALDIAVDALDLKQDDEVIMPSFTIISCITGILRKGVVPIFVDQEEHTWNMNVSQIRERITNKTKAIMVVHIYGLPVDMDPVLELSKEFGLKIIEDAAEMHGQTYHGKMCGSFGDLSTFSFYPNKHITTGEGGMILTDDEDLFERCQLLRNLCFVPERRFKHYELGYNARITNMQAALGLAQLERIQEFVDKKRHSGALYQDLLQDAPGLLLPTPSTDYAKNIYWVFGVILSEDISNPTDVMDELRKKGIGTRPFFWGLHEQPLLEKYKFFKKQRLPVCEKLTRRGFYLPSGLKLTDDQITYVSNSFLEILNKLQ